MEHLDTLIREMEIVEHRGYSVTVIYEWKDRWSKFLWWMGLIEPEIPTVELENPMTGEHQWCEMRGVPLYYGGESRLVQKGAAFLRVGKYRLSVSAKKKTSKYFNVSIYYGPLPS